MSFSYQWYRGGSPIPTANSANYVFTEDDVDMSVACMVTATNAYGSTSVFSIPIGEGTVGLLFASDGSTLDGWAINGVTVDSIEGNGNPAPGFRAWPTHNYAYIAPPGITDLVGKSIQFDAKIQTGGLADFFFGCNSAGVGRMLRLEGRVGSYYSGISTASSWTSWDSPYSSTSAVTDGVWHTYQIDIKSGPVIDLWKDNVKTLSNVPVVLSGVYIGLQGDGGSFGGFFDNIQIFNTPY